MRILTENDYQIVNIEQLPSIFSSGVPAKKIAVITFDDGYQDFYTTAFPILKKYNFTADVFLPTAFIGKERHTFNSKQCLVWDEVSTLSNAGIRFGSHTVHHTKLVDMSRKEIEYELKTAKAIIENNVRMPALSFSHPFKFPEQDKQYVLTLEKILEETGYSVGVSTRIGTTRQNDNMYYMRRIPINRHDDSVFFKAKLTSGYNWLHPLQKLWKTLAWRRWITK
ncbi:MAG: polysaccharide deacetylase family protein [Desulfobacterales bacterium]|nr:polysaccharide deacetylase family protein [Desulfobacterales bacterium]